MSELFYRFVILIVALVNVAIDNWLMLLILAVLCYGSHRGWKSYRAGARYVASRSTDWLLFGAMMLLLYVWLSC